MSQPKIKTPSKSPKGPTKFAYTLTRRDGGYCVTTYKIDDEGYASEVSTTEPNLLQIAITYMQHAAITAYHQINAGEPGV
jgi:hypothetical protein